MESDMEGFGQREADVYSRSRRSAWGEGDYRYRRRLLARVLSTLAICIAVVSSIMMWSICS